MKIIMFGPPGAGKGTQAEIISTTLNIPTISTGATLREAMKNGTEMGLKAKSFMDSGKLVPDEVVIGIIEERLQNDDCKNGFILDGFPRTIPQAEALDKMGIVIDKAISIEVADEVIASRLSGRRVCEKCGRPYHIVDLQPKVEGVCDDCAGTLVQRKDDHIDTIKARLEIYHNETEPLKDYYQAQGKLFIVEGQDKVEDTTALTLKALEA
jgi:adenylate kinase